MTQLFLYGFKDKKWTKQEDNKTENIFDSVSILTFNTLFDKYNSEIIHSKERWKVQFLEFSKLKANIMVLQEVRLDYLKLLLEEPFIQENYLISSLDEWLFENYTTITLIHKEICITKSFSLKYSHEEASHNVAIVNQVILDGENPLGVIGVHFRHSSKKVNVRKTQLEDIYALCIENQWKDYIILGDFNFEHKEDIKSIRPNISYDVWTELNKDETATYDSYKNDLVRGVIKCRLDRIVFSKSSKQHYTPTKIELVLNKPFSEIYPDLKVPNSKNFYLSDHFGLISLIQSKKSITNL